LEKAAKQAVCAVFLMSKSVWMKSDKLKGYRKKIANKLKKDKCPAQWGLSVLRVKSK